MRCHDGSRIPSLSSPEGEKNKPGHLHKVMRDPVMGKGGREVLRNPQQRTSHTLCNVCSRSPKGPTGSESGCCRRAQSRQRCRGGLPRTLGQCSSLYPKNRDNTGKESPTDKQKNTTVTRRRVSRGKQCSA